MIHQILPILPDALANRLPFLGRVCVHGPDNLRLRFHTYGSHGKDRIAIKLARRLEELGVKATPVFWVAAEDHDHEEIESAWLLNRDSGLSRIRVDLSGPEPAPARLRELIERLAASDAVPERRRG